MTTKRVKAKKAKATEPEYETTYTMSLSNEMARNFTCTKRFGSYPFAHRQPKHDGHCSLVHGHNWSFVVTFASTKLNECGFVVDFGKLESLKRLFYENFDHTLVLNADDPLVKKLALKTLAPFYRVILVPDCSCEGLARWIYDKVSEILAQETEGRVHVVEVIVEEDEKNSAAYKPDLKYDWVDFSWTA